jgi:hypothetical protein
MDADAELEIPKAPDEAGVLADETGFAPVDFIPARERSVAQPRELPVIRYLLLALFGLIFVGFGLFWGVSYRADAASRIPPMAVAWLAGVAGIGFLVYAVYYIVQHLGRIAERD